VVVWRCDGGATLTVDDRQSQRATSDGDSDSESESTDEPRGGRRQVSQLTE
jgi:hypothetical protein